MKMLLNTSQAVQDQFDKDSDRHGDNRNHPGEQFAAILLILYTSSALIISAWSAIVIKSGNIESGGPIGLFVQILKTSGII